MNLLTRRLKPGEVALVLLGLYLLATAYGSMVGWKHRSVRFAAFARIVEERGGEVHGMSNWGTHADNVVLAPNTDLQTFQELSNFAMAGHIGTLDLSATKLKQKIVIATREWSLINADTTLWAETNH